MATDGNSFTPEHRRFLSGILLSSCSSSYSARCRNRGWPRRANSPRVRGNRCQHANGKGSNEVHPRARAKLLDAAQACPLNEFTPARAGRKPNAPTCWRARLDPPGPYGATDPVDLYAGAHVGSSPQLWSGSPTRHRVMVIVGSCPCWRGGWAGTGPDAWRQGYISSLAGDSVPSRSSEQPFGLRLSSRLDCGGRCPVSVGAGRLCLAEPRRSPPLTPAGTWRAGIGLPSAAAARLSSAFSGAPTAPASWYASAQTCWRTPMRSSSCLRVLVSSMLLMTLLLGLSETRLSPDARQQCPADLVARMFP